MNEHFEEMLRRLKLTKPQRDDARTKYTTVAKLLHKEFYDTEYNGSTKLLTGSYGKHTNIRPPSDIDLLFKIPAEIYDQYQDSPSALLQRVRKVIGAHYTTTEKISAWGKVVLVKFPDGKHDVELLPAFEVGGVFMIPNTEEGGSWESFDARADLNIVKDSDAATGGKTRPLVRIVKRWRKQTKTVTIKPFEIEQYCADFLQTYDYGSASWSSLVADFFAWLGSVAEKDATQIQTAINRTKKARKFETNGKYKEACDEWRKVFGNRTFPAYSANLSKVVTLAKRFVAPAEQHIEDMFPVRIDPAYSADIHSTVSGKGFRTYGVREFLARFPRFLKHMGLSFSAATTVPGDVRVFWKVRNFGEEAQRLNQLRGEIEEGAGLSKRDENTLYLGDHYVECYMVKDGVCVARALQFVPIGEEE
jgi:hypothetical protein